MIEQQVTVPANRPYLRYWHWIASEDACGYDVGGVIIEVGDEDDVVDGTWLCRSENTNGWRMRFVDLRKYAGQSVLLEFLGGTDGALNSNWFVDDIVFVSSSAALTAQIPVRVDDPALIERLEVIFDQLPE